MSRQQSLLISAIAISCARLELLQLGQEVLHCPDCIQTRCTFHNNREKAILRLSKLATDALVETYEELALPNPAGEAVRDLEEFK